MLVVHNILRKDFARTRKFGVQQKNIRVVHPRAPVKVAAEYGITNGMRRFRYGSFSLCPPAACSRLCLRFIVQALQLLGFTAFFFLAERFELARLRLLVKFIEEHRDRL